MSSLLNKTTVIVAISCLLVGRYVLTPKPKVVTKEVVKIVEIEKKTVDTKKTKVTKEVKDKDGTVVVETTETEDTTIYVVNSTEVDSSKVSKSGGAAITLGLLAQKALDNLARTDYGVVVVAPLTGNLRVVGTASTDKRIGVGLAIDF
jgi:flagellar hook assembly protein FlgD